MALPLVAFFGPQRYFVHGIVGGRGQGLTGHVQDPPAVVGRNSTYQTSSREPARSTAQLASVCMSSTQIRSVAGRYQPTCGKSRTTPTVTVGPATITTRVPSGRFSVGRRRVGGSTVYRSASRSAMR